MVSKLMQNVIFVGWLAGWLGRNKDYFTLLWVEIGNVPEHDGDNVHRLSGHVEFVRPSCKKKKKKE